MRVPLASVLGLTLSTALAGEPSPEQERVTESVEVQLLLLDVHVLDRHGGPVPGLSVEDFEVSFDGRTRPIATFDVLCAESAQTPAMVLAFDYQHLNEVERGRALSMARRALEGEGRGDLEILVAGLVGGLRVEQPFTSDRTRIGSALARMDDDLRLRAGNFAHASEDGFVRGLTALFDVVGTVSRPKAILLFSAMGDVPLDEQFANLAAMAAASRSVVYPVDVRGLDTEDPLAAAGPLNPHPGSG